MDAPLIETEARPALSAPSSPCDNDAYNTPDARLHFGPLRSPEKKFVPSVARPSDLQTHAVNSLRRSPRLSSPRPTPHLRATIMVPVENEGISDEVQGWAHGVTNSSHLGTPENEQGLQDEPSSVLASRIIRAQDNPSPPPNGPNFLVTNDASASPTPPVVCSPRPELPPRDDSGSKVGLVVRECSVEPLATTTNPVATPDLISFDSFSTPTESFHSIITKPGPMAQHSDISSIDVLFTRSPSPAPPRADATFSASLVAAAPQKYGECDTLVDRSEMTPESIDEQTVIRSLFPSTDGSLGDPPSETTTTHAQGPDHAESASDAPTQPTGPQYTYVVAQLIEERETLLNDSADDAAVRRKGKERKRSEVSMDAELVADAGVKLSEDGVTEMLTQEETMRKADQDILNTPTQADYRELGSLSPTSANLLIQLLPSPIRGTTPILQVQAQDDTDTMITQPSTSLGRIPGSLEPTTSFPQLLPIPRTPIRSQSPTRFSSPVRGNTMQSSNKSRLWPAALDDPSRTPARRITIDEAVTQGHISPQKAARLTADHGRTPVFNIRPTDSPARRVNIADAPTPSSQKKWQGIRFGSPTRNVSRQRSTSIEPQALVSSNGKGTGRASSSQRPLPSKDASSSRSQTAGPSSADHAAAHRPAKLPFPIVASQTHLPSSASEESHSKAKMSSPIKPSAGATSPIKSGLKQTTSKIPRGVKPYARPPSSKSSLVTTVEPTKPGNSSRIISKQTDTRANTVSGSLPNGKPEPSLATPGKPTVSSALKRKRMPEKASPTHKSRPVVLLRQVPRIAGPLPNTDTIYTKKAVQPIRRVVDRQPSPPPVQLSPPGPDKDVHLDEESGLRSIPEDAVINITSPTSPMMGADSSSSPPPSVELSEQPSGSDTRRRTTRSRKPVRPIDVFGGSEPRSAPSRRKINAQPSVLSDGAFSSMTAVALKALTSSNTIKNQKYLAAKLETKVIRKEGTRPESPAVKIRTISQRMQDEKAKQRKERAARRAGRGDGGSSGMEQTETEAQSDSEEPSDWDDQNSSPGIKRHKRGPGEEEDYETPIRPERHAKRPRLGEGEETMRTERRVKWDRGLFTMIFVDEMKLGTRPPPKENIVTKGCLALAAKAAPLDNLGNLPEANSPLGALVEESVEVKKFVYDNDEEPLSPVIVVKNTRLRSKKAKG